MGRKSIITKVYQKAATLLQLRGCMLQNCLRGECGEKFLLQALQIRREKSHNFIQLMCITKTGGSPPKSKSL